MSISKFQFHGNLTDFIKLPTGQSIVSYKFTGNPSIKDAIEAIGVPHPEIQDITSYGSRLSLADTLEEGAFIQVYPFTKIENVPLKFILDVHLGKLARWLRLLGFDVYYENHYSDKDIINLIQKEQRIVLTRDIGLLKIKSVVMGYWLRSQEPKKQLAEVMERFHLNDHIHPFTRCPLCNGLLQRVEKKQVENLLPPRSRLFFKEIYQCQYCQKVYWKGSHYERMLQQWQGIF
jgi:uncharacterized protein with PIN domain